MFTRRDFIKGLAGLGIIATGIEAFAMEPDHIAAHKHCSNHKEELLNSRVCGCFCCLSTFPPSEISEWLDVENGRPGPTALCPKCGIDSVIGSRSGYPVTQEFLAGMEKFFFGMRKYDIFGNPIGWS